MWGKEGKNKSDRIRQKLRAFSKVAQGIIEIEAQWQYIRFMGNNLEGHLHHLFANYEDECKGELLKYSN